MRAAVIAIILTALLCLPLGYAAGWFWRDYNFWKHDAVRLMPMPEEAVR